MAVPEALAAIPGVRTAAQLSEPTLTVLPELAGLLPGGGLRRGSTVSVRGATSLVLALLAEATRNGSWAAVTGLPELGLAAAAELGVDLERLALVPDPGAELVAVLSALVDGFDLVVLGRAVPVQPQTARRLAGRVRNRGTVLLTAGAWPGADVELKVSGRRWHGLTQDGHGHLRARKVLATSTGRGAAARPLSVGLWLPGPEGAPAASTNTPPGRRLVEVAG
ncbi:hypothetical protein [Amycolatopsis kentuckyensis]|uniref:hypothetical protein n=1 Tax=Amycolatopsis kentuckyensis TaxID=218823 RepID=UPI000A3A3835|nr:hypothetical protein [Amycolatopsis kentuckyensis]